jgi:ribosomal protein S18 acetylase RimI-like enzyme
MLPDVVDRYARWLPTRANDPRSVFLVAERSATTTDAAPALVGFLIATIEENIPIYRLEEFGFIHDVWVEPSARKSGAATALVTEALRRFRTLSITQVRLETAAINEPARRLFTRCGFRIGTIDMLVEL